MPASASSDKNMKIQLKNKLTCICYTTLLTALTRMYLRYNKIIVTCTNYSEI